MPSSVSSHIPGKSRPKGGRLHLPLALGLVLLIVFAAVVGGAHHHDLEHHSDCAACAVAHHAGVEPSVPSLPAPFPPAPPFTFAPFILIVPFARPASLRRSRAPPR